MAMAKRKSGLVHDNSKAKTPHASGKPFGGAQSPWTNSRPLAHMAEVVPSPGGNANNSMLPINKSRKGFLKGRGAKRGA